MVTQTELDSLDVQADEALARDEDATVDVSAQELKHLVDYIRELEDDVMDLRHQLAESEEDDLFDD